jgi:hypothetical protein
MSTVFFNLVTLPYTTTNDVEVRLYKTTSPFAVVASQSKPAPHGQHTWSFPGLDRTNYIVRIFDMESPIPVQLGQDFTVIPDNNTIKLKDPFWIIFDDTINPSTGLPFASGVNTFTVEDWIGWDIIADRKGADTQHDPSDYHWDILTGTFTLNVSGDLFQPLEKWFIEFVPLYQQSESVSSGAFGRLWSERLKITASISLSETDIAKKILIKGALTYLEVTLPSLSAVAEDTVTWFESCRGYHMCVKVICDGSDVVDFFGASRNYFHMIPDETIEIWKEVDPDTLIAVWRVQNAVGNFGKIGRFVSDYGGSVFGSIAATSSTLNIRSYARLYQEHVKLLSYPQVCAFTDWNTGNNRYMYSLADTETDSGVFHTPDITDLIEKNAGGFPAGYFEDWQVGRHKHAAPFASNFPVGSGGKPFGGAGFSNKVGSGSEDNDNDYWYTNDGSELLGTLTSMNPNDIVGADNRPDSYRAIKRILI